MINKLGLVRDSLMRKVADFLGETEGDVLQTGSQKICVPIVDADGNEGYCEITFAIPKGSRDGTLFDGYEAAENYKLETARKIAEKEERERKKAAKILRDKAAREELARKKAEREKGE